MYPDQISTITEALHCFCGIGRGKQKRMGNGSVSTWNCNFRHLTGLSIGFRVQNPCWLMIVGDSHGFSGGKNPVFLFSSWSQAFFCAFFRNGHLLTSWSRQWHWALELLSSMSRHKLCLDVFSCSAAMSCCEKGSQWSKAERSSVEKTLVETEYRDH